MKVVNLEEESIQPKAVLGQWWGRETNRGGEKGETRKKNYWDSLLGI